MNDKKMNELKYFNTGNDNKVGVSIYLSSHVFDEIEDFLFSVKRKLPIRKRRKLTKSIFYETSLRIAIEDFNKNGEESSLWKAISEIMKD